MFNADCAPIFYIKIVIDSVFACSCQDQVLKLECFGHWINEQPRRKRRGIKQKILTAPRGGELNPRPALADKIYL